ncbi:MAG: 1-deoxy-D-xylulose-5-phosphate synthase [Gammaproteobacteria bacterium]|nr:1-deoxy-D-xylulose-5-phosphate synthase [Gammaproteobacteria bacterium]
MPHRYTLLKHIHSPADLRSLPEKDYPQLAAEVREFLLESVSSTGGHLAAGLGTVELTIALHAVFNTPHDRLVWDIGHQAYPHKILTGRREAMNSLRQQDGLSGFLSREESEYDVFGAGHSSTSISAALGIAVAAKQAGNGRKSVAVIGDGAMTAGMAFEALNNAGDQDCDLLVILNDNEMSISPNRGALHNHLSRLLSGRMYTGIRQSSKLALNRLPGAQHFLRRWEEHLKGMVMPGTLFEELGFNYIGPIDGHDLPTLMSTLRNMHKLEGRNFLHVVTRKGMGYDPAEQDPCVYHGVTPFDRATGVQKKSAGSSKTYTQVFSEWLCDMAGTDKQLTGITPAMCEGSGMVDFARSFADRYFDVGIAEQHAVTFAGGMACEGMKPVVAIYSTFLQRAYDQLIHDIALQNLDVTFAIDRAGLVGADGATHAGVFDLSFLRCVPNMLVMAPANEQECRQMLSTAYQYKGPAAVRYPRGTGPGTVTDNSLETLPIGKAVITREGARIAILAFGSRHAAAQEAGDAIDATVVNMRFIKPLDTDMIMAIAAGHDLLVTVEENVLQGGAGSAVNEVLHAHNAQTRVINLGIPDAFIEHGDHGQQLSACGLDTAGILVAIESEEILTAPAPATLPSGQQLNG